MKQELDSKTRRSILRGRNSGQAVVEYILIVSIAVAFVFILKGTFSSLSEFADNYLGSYTTCLMAHGELPALGVSNNVTFSDGSGLKEHLSGGYTCNSGFKPFTLAEGRPPIANGSASGGSSRNSSNGKGSNNSSSTTSGDDSSSKKSSGKDKNGDSETAGAGGSGAGGSNPYDDGRIRRGGRSTADGLAGAGNSNTRLIDEEGDGDEAGGRRRKRSPRESRIIYRDRGRYKAILGQEAEQLLNKTERSSIKRKPSSRAIAKIENGDLSGPRTGLMKLPPEKKVVEAETKEEAWGFGKLLKWLLIIGIIIALVIFFGGQLLNYSNSDS